MQNAKAEKEENTISGKKINTKNSLQIKSQG